MRRDEARVTQKLHPHIERVAAVGRAEILHQEGDAAERSVGNCATLCLRASLLEQRDDYRIQLRVKRLDASNCCVDQVQRRSPALPDQLGLSNRIKVSKLILHSPASWRWLEWHS